MKTGVPVYPSIPPEIATEAAGNAKLDPPATSLEMAQRRISQGRIWSKPRIA